MKKMLFVASMLIIFAGCELDNINALLSQATQLQGVVDCIKTVVTLNS